MILPRVLGALLASLLSLSVSTLVWGTAVGLTAWSLEELAGQPRGNASGRLFEEHFVFGLTCGSVDTVDLFLLSLLPSLSTFIPVLLVTTGDLPPCRGGDATEAPPALVPVVV
mmetsp:Transcript_88423/g.170274  ORF Transcript_88423/g.170274 Transcript_88423/m.170274 type:complete len:113 (+) Transcript_88423:127-465(+)